MARKIRKYVHTVTRNLVLKGHFYDNIATKIIHSIKKKLSYFGVKFNLWCLHRCIQCSVLGKIQEYFVISFFQDAFCLTSLVYSNNLPVHLHPNINLA